MALTCTIAPLAHPVSLAQAKRQLRVDHSDDDTLINSLIGVAVDYCQMVTASRFAMGTYRLDLDRFPEYGRISTHYCLDDTREQIILPIGPVNSVTSITYKDSDGTSQTWSSSEYTLVKTGTQAVIECKPGYTFPARGVSAAAVSVTFVAGHGAYFTASGATLTVNQGIFAANDPVNLYTTDADLPALLSTGTVYYIKGPFTGNTYNLATTSGGSAITTTDAGTGNHFLGLMPESGIHAVLMLISHLYEHRSASVDRNTLPPQIQWLLSTLCWGGM